MEDQELSRPLYTNDAFPTVFNSEQKQKAGSRALCKQWRKYNLLIEAEIKRLTSVKRVQSKEA